MAEKFDKYVLKNGMSLLGERMEGVESVAFDFMLPAGATLLPEGCCGAGNIISDWLSRGAGDRNNRELNDALDSLGLHRSSVINTSHLTVGAVLEASNLAQAIDLYADMILHSKLEDDQFELARQLAIDVVHSLDDDPRQKVMLKLKEHFYPYPLGRSTVGEIDQLAALTAEKTRQIVKNYFNLSQAVFTIAGKYNFDKVVTQIEKLFETEKQKPIEITPAESRTGKYTHIHNDGAQIHIGLMTKTVRPADKDYYNARLAAAVLSGGMSARLFTEVREKRGLCYAIGARYHGLKEAAGFACYAGTVPEKGQETLNVIIQEFNRLGEGISEEELERAKIGLKAALILQSESSSNRASSLGSDFYMLGRIRSLDEIKNEIEATSVKSILEFLQRNKFEEFTIVTIGPKEISVK
jgi:predicted Zn-dependent peptidase